MMKRTPYTATAAGDLPHCNLRLGAALTMRPPGAFGASLGSLPLLGSGCQLPEAKCAACSGWW